MSEMVDTPAGKALSLNALQGLSLAELMQRARDRGLRIRMESSRHHLIMDILRDHLLAGGEATATGFLEMSAEQGTLRWLEYSLRPCSEDAQIPAALLRPLDLRPGVLLTCRLGVKNERGLFVTEIVAVEGIPVSEWKPPMDFEKLTPLFPNRRVFLEAKDNPDLAARAVDLVAPLGMGQRGIIAAPPRSGKTILLRTLAKAIRKNHPEVCLILLLVDERPEEVSDFKNELDCEIYASTFDEPVARHVQVCEAVCERAKRLVELGRDVVILLDSITRMARGYNNLQPSKGGRTMSGGVDAKALARPRKFFGSARNTEEGGSLTILATALIETQSRMDDLIFEEFKGTGNMEIYLDRMISDLRIYPAIHIIKSGTRREDLLYHPDEMEHVALLRRQLSELPAAEAMETLLVNLRHTKSNVELLMTGLRGV